MLDRHVGRETAAELILDLADVILGLGGELRLGRFLVDRLARDRLGDELLGVAHVQLPLHDEVGEHALLGLGLEPEKGLGVTARQHLPRDECLHLGIEVKKADRIRDRGAVFADALGDLLLLQAEFLGQSRVGLGLLEGIEILALEVLDEGHLEHVAVRGIAHDHRHLRQLQLGRGPPAALPGDEFILPVHEPHDERLDHPMFADRIDQLGEVLLVETLARLQGRGHHLVQRDAKDPLARGRIIGSTAAGWTHRHRTRSLDQGVETATESFFGGEVLRHLAKRA